MKKTGGDGLSYYFWSSVVIPAGGYSDGNVLATQIQTAMDNCIDPNANLSFTVTWNSNQLSINNSQNMHI